MFYIGAECGPATNLVQQLKKRNIYLEVYENNATATILCMWYMKLHYLFHVLGRSLRSLLDGEMEHSAGLRQETDVLKKKLAELEERHTAKVQALAR